MTPPRLRRTDAALLGAALLAGALSLGAGAASALESWSAIPETFQGAADYRGAAEVWALKGQPLASERPPLYPLFLAMLLKLVGRDALPYAAVLCQGLLALLVHAGALWLAWRRTGKAWLAAGAGLSLAGNLFWAREVFALRETVLYGALLLGIVAVAGQGPLRRWPVALALGGLVALAWLTRPTGVAIAAGVGIWMVQGAWCKVLSAKCRVQSVAAFTAGVAVPLLFWVGYQGATGAPVRLSGGSSAINLWKGNTPLLRAIQYPQVDVDLLDRVIEEDFGSNPARLWEAMAFDARLIPAKLAAFFVPLHFPSGAGTLEKQGGEWVLASYEPLPWSRRLLGLGAILGVLAFFAALVLWQRQSPTARLIVLLTALTAIIHVVTFAETRFRLPYDPLLAVLAAEVAGGMLGARFKVQGAVPSSDRDLDRR